MACNRLPVALSPGGSGGSGGAVTFQAHGSVEQIWVVHAQPGATLTVVRGNAPRTITSATADANGGMIFRQLTPGIDYRVVQDAGGTTTRSGFLDVMSQSPTPPSTSIYHQTLNVGGWAGHEKDGYGYLTTRDGTKLAVMVRLPGPPDKGPYPTVVEYSGYSPADPDSPQPMTRLSGLMGYATVGINIRGTGCSGGAFDYFERLQSLDGYDAIETVARQPWVLGNKVGMVGISYPGISQLFVGATQPPHLEAITPLSVIDNTATTLDPGGILNDGFALSWGKDRVHDSQAGGQKWSQKRMDNGDTTCQDNMGVRLQTPDLLAKIYANTHYIPAVADPLNPSKFVDKIKVPTFMACQWQDEQTGGHCANLVKHFTGTSKAWFNFTNGTHVDSLDPATFVHWYDFLELYVAHRKPSNGALLKALGPAIYKTAMNVDGVQIPDDPIWTQPDYAHALAAFNALPKVRVAFDNGGSTTPGNPVGTFEKGYSSFPVPGTTAQAWYFGPGGTLTSGKPTVASGHDHYVSDPSVRPRADFGGSTSDIWVAAPDWNWTQLVGGNALAYTSKPLSSNEVMAGFGSVDLWLTSSATDTDLQVTLTEIRPDGKEEYVQSGWLRASDRKLDPTSTVLDPIATGLASDVRLLTPGKASLARVELYPFAHAFRKGSRIRISVSAPGGDRPFWTFTNLPGTPLNSIARTAALPSRVVLPLVGTNVPTPLPTCTLRGEPCHDALAFTNAS